MKSVLLTLLVMIAAARAEGEVGSFVKHLSGDVTAGIYDFNQGQWRWQGATIAGATAMSSYLFYRINDQPLRNSTTSNTLGDASIWISNVGNCLPLAWPVGFFVGGVFFKKGSPQRDKAFSVAEELAESISFTYVTNTALKVIFNRTRPTGGHYSFPSGHTAPNFAAAGTLAYLYPWYIGVPALLVVSAVGFSRVDLNQHFASDVVAGAGLGLFFATSVYLNHRDLHAKTDSPRTDAFSPLILDNTYGLICTKML